MKSFKIILFVVFAAILSAGCKKDDVKPLPVTTDASQAKLKIVYTSAYLIRDSVQLKVNGQRVSNTFISSTTAFLPTPYPGGGLNTGGGQPPLVYECTSRRNADLCSGS